MPAGGNHPTTQFDRRAEQHDNQEAHMPHTTPPPSGTLSDGCRPVVGATASARTPDQSPDQSGVTAIWSQTHTDHLGRLWTWDPGFDCYRHADTSGGTILSLPETLADRQLAVRAALPLNVFEWVWEHSRATGLAREVLLNLAWTPAIDYEHLPWPGYLHLWLHSGDDVTVDHQYTEDDLRPVVEAVMELIALGELLLINPSEDPVPMATDFPDNVAVFPSTVDLSRSCLDVTYTLPAYQRWTVEHEVSW
jgi:hypothetical protein